MSWMGCKIFVFVVVDDLWWYVVKGMLLDRFL